MATDHTAGQWSRHTKKGKVTHHCGYTGHWEYERTSIMLSPYDTACTEIKHKGTNFTDSR